MLGNLDNLLNRDDALLFVGGEINNNDVGLHRLNFVKYPTVQSRIEIIQLSSDFDLIRTLQNLTNMVPKPFIRTDYDCGQQ